MASFLGSPPITLLDGEIIGGLLRMAGEDWQALPQQLPDRRVKVGLRAENLTLAEDGAADAFSVRVESVSKLGGAVTVDAHLADGQLIWERGAPVFARDIALPYIDAIIGLASRHGFAYGGYNRYGEVVSEINERVHAVWSRFGCPVPRVVSTPEREAPLYQGHLYITKAEGALFSPLFNEYLTNWSDEFLMNLIPRSAGKSAAVAWCLEHYPCPLEHTYAFGDGFNDVDLLAAVGHGVAVGGDKPELVAAAEHTVLSAEEGGLLQAFDYYGI